MKRLRRDVGPQITGYLVDLAAKDPEMAKTYVKSMKLYWQYRLEKQRETNSRTDLESPIVIMTQPLSKVKPTIR